MLSKYVVCIVRKGSSNTNMIKVHSKSSRIGTLHGMYQYIYRISGIECVSLKKVFQHTQSFGMHFSNPVN